MLLVLFVAIAEQHGRTRRAAPIIGALDGTQTEYTWVITATLLTSTATNAVLGQAGRPVEQEAAIQVAHRRSSSSSVLSGLSRAPAAHRLPRPAGGGPRRPPGAGEDRARRYGRRPGSAAATPAGSARVCARDRRRSAGRRRIVDTTASAGAGVLRRRPVRAARAGAAAPHAAPAGRKRDRCTSTTWARCCSPAA